jgi:hypothetical protein
MFDLITANPYPLFVAAFALALYGAYRLGTVHGSVPLPLMCERPHEVAQVDPYVDVVPEWDAVPEVELSGFLEPEIVGVDIDVRTEASALDGWARVDPQLPPSPSQAHLDELASLQDDVQALTRDRDWWRSVAAHKDMLRARYLRLLRGERARLGYMLGTVMDAPRRPAKAKLAAVVLELPRGRHLSLVPPLVANEWRAA